MGVLDPVNEKASEAIELEEEFSEILKEEIDKLNNDCNRAAIIEDRRDLLEENEIKFNAFWTNEEILNLQTEEEIDEKIEEGRKRLSDISLESLRMKLSQRFTEEHNKETDYKNPLESYKQLESLDKKLENLCTTINQKIKDKTDGELEILGDEIKFSDYDNRKVLYESTDNIKAFPLIEGIIESQEKINQEQENLLAKAVDEHREHKNSINTEYESVDIPNKPVDWEEVIEEDHVSDWVKLTGFSDNITYGDTLHLMMEEYCGELESVQPEYTLHFLNKGSEECAMQKENRVDNSLSPDALGDLFVYEFKHIPREKRHLLNEGNSLKDDKVFREGVKQVNNYLNTLDMSHGMLVNISSDIQIQEYVVEQHPRSEEYIDQNVHKKEEYEF